MMEGKPRRRHTDGSKRHPRKCCELHEDRKPGTFSCLYRLLYLNERWCLQFFSLTTLLERYFINTASRGLQTKEGRGEQEENKRKRRMPLVFLLERVNLETTRWGAELQGVELQGVELHAHVFILYCVLIRMEKEKKKKQQLWHPRCSAHLQGPGEPARKKPPDDYLGAPRGLPSLLHELPQLDTSYSPPKSPFLPLLALCPVVALSFFATHFLQLPRHLSHFFTCPPLFSRHLSLHPPYSLVPGHCASLMPHSDSCHTQFCRQPGVKTDVQKNKSLIFVATDPAWDRLNKQVYRWSFESRNSLFCCWNNVRFLGNKWMKILSIVWATQQQPDFIFSLTSCVGFPSPAPASSHCLKTCRVSSSKSNVSVNGRPSPCVSPVTDRRPVQSRGPPLRQMSAGISSCPPWPCKGTSRHVARHSC